jgi:hypothetical protein
VRHPQEEIKTLKKELLVRVVDKAGSLSFVEDQYLLQISRFLEYQILVNLEATLDRVRNSMD